MNICCIIYVIYVLLSVVGVLKLGDYKMCLLVRTAAGKDTQTTVTGNNSIKDLGIYMYEHDIVTTCLMNHE